MTDKINIENIIKLVKEQEPDRQDVSSNFMKTFIITILSILILNPTYSQFALKKDSITIVTTASLKIDYQKPLSELYLKGYSSGFYNRIDSIKYDYAFIKETLRNTDSFFIITESYYLSGDTLPFIVFINGKVLETGFQEYKISLKEMLRQYNQLKPIQTLTYSENQERLHVCGLGRNGRKQQTEKEFIRNRKIELKNTYQIQTFIDRKLELINVSVQTPAINPKFKVVRTDL